MADLKDEPWPGSGQMFREEYNVIHPDWRTPVFVTVSLSLLLKDSAASQVSMMHGTLSC